MDKYIALLRGVNVGGKNKIQMPILKVAFEKAGFGDVRTYINSGNIIFSSEETDIIVLQQKCRQIIMDSFTLDIVTSVISATDLSAALNNVPAWWDTDEESKHNAIFVIKPTSTVSVMEAIGQTKPEYERIAYHGQVIFWSAPIKTFSRTRLSKLVSAKSYNSITIRNANTTKKLSVLAGE